MAFMGLYRYGCFVVKSYHNFRYAEHKQEPQRIYHHYGEIGRDKKDQRTNSPNAPDHSMWP